jgi:hypothetical protein
MKELTFEPRIGCQRITGLLLSEIPRITPLLSEIVRLGSPLRAFARDPVGAFARVSIGAFARKPERIGTGVGYGGLPDGGTTLFDTTMLKVSVTGGTWPPIKGLGPFFRDRLVLLAYPFGRDMSAFAFDTAPAF